MPAQRLKKRTEFLKLTRSGQREFTSAFVLQILETDAGQPVRFGFTTSKKIGNAVRRNRARRRLRAVVDAAVRLNPNFQLPADKSYDFVLVARYAAPQVEFDKMVYQLKRHLKALGCEV